MDAIFSSSSSQKSVSQQLKNNTLRRYNNGTIFSSKQNKNLPYNTSIIHGGGGGEGGEFLFAPPASLSFSYNHSPSLLNPLSNYQNYHQQPQLQPPLLPLPLPNKPLHVSFPSRSRSLSSAPPNAKNKRNKDPKRSKPKQFIGKSVEEPKKRQLKPSEATKTFVMASGPVPNDLDKFTTSIFTLSPPPSSLPLPSFSLRPKLSCNGGCWSH